MLLTLHACGAGRETALCLWEFWKIKHLLESLEVTTVCKNTEHKLYVYFGFV